MNYELVITCLVCGAQRASSGLQEQPNLSDTEVLAQAGHSPQCTLDSAKVAIRQEQRPGEPNVVLYTIAEVS